MLNGMMLEDLRTSKSQFLILFRHVLLSIENLHDASIDRCIMHASILFQIFFIIYSQIFIGNT